MAYARANPGKLNIGFAQGTGPQFVAEAFKAVAGIDVVGIPYAGGSQVVRDLLGGSVQLYFGSAATTLPLIEAGRCERWSAPVDHAIPCCPTCLP